MRNKIIAIMASLVTLAFSLPFAKANVTDDIRPRPTVLLPSPTPSFAPIIVMSVGDSLTESIDPLTKGSTYASYRGDLSVLLFKTGQPHTWVVQALGGTKCSYWAERMAGMLAQYHPDIVFLNCGTNDTPTDNTEADYRTIIQAVINDGHAQLVPSLIGIPNMKTDTNRVRPYIIDWMYQTNQAILRALADYPQLHPADMRRVPAKSEWLYPDGIHLIARSEAAYAWLFYDAVRLSRGWIKAEEMCGLDGVDPGAPEMIPDVDYVPCRSR